MIKSEKETQAEIVWDLLYKCEIQGTLNEWSDAQKKAELRKHLKRLKTTKKYAYKQLKRTVEGAPTISEYVDGIGKIVTSPEKMHNNVKTNFQ